jgi:hypothetical protein
MQALVSLLSSDGYQGLTIEQAMERYAPPDENDTDAYTSFIADNVGVDPSTPVSDLTSDQRECLRKRNPSVGCRSYALWHVGESQLRHHPGIHLRDTVNCSLVLHVLIQALHSLRRGFP